MTTGERRDIELAQLAFDTVLKWRERGRNKHPDDNGDDKDVLFQMNRARRHLLQAGSPLEMNVGECIEKVITRATMALLKHEEE